MYESVEKTQSSPQTGRYVQVIAIGLKGRDMKAQGKDTQAQRGVAVALG